MNIIILGVRIIEDSDNRGSDNRGCTVNGFSVMILINTPGAYTVTDGRVYTPIYL